MISPNYYKDANTVKVYQKGNVSHFYPKKRTLVTKKYQYTIQQGDTIYSLAKAVFGVDSEYLWTVIADINPIRMPDEWEAGETIWLPEEIIQDVYRGNERSVR